MEQVETFMLTIGGKRFRCEDCKSNCFHKHCEPQLNLFEPPKVAYICNGCDAKYISES